MEQELNIAAILKDKLKGTMLYDIQKGIRVEFCCIETIKRTKEAIIWCNYQKGDRTLGLGYSESGKERGWEDGMQILKPSKEMQDWSKFAWKKGDVLVDNKGYTCLFCKWKDDTYTSFIGKYTHFEDLHNRSIRLSTDNFHKIISNEKIDEIIKEVEAYYNGKLNLETLEIEKPEPQFKDGDIVFIEQNETFAETVLILRKICNDKLTVYAFVNCDTYECYFDTNKYITIDNRKMRKATDSERQYLFKHLAKEGKRWNAETKTLEDLPKKCEFKPKDWCLMRKGSIDTWHLCQYSDTCDDGYYGYYAVGGNFFKECIPYNEQTKHLLGTTDDWKGGK